MVHTAANDSTIERSCAHVHMLDRFPRLPVPVFPSFWGPVLSPTIILGDLTALILMYIHWTSLHVSQAFNCSLS